MNDLRDLYQEVIFDHNRNPRNCYCMKGANRTAEGFNPLCGDRLTLYLKVEDDKIVEASFQGSGCAISTASASLMTEALKGKSLEEAERLFQAFHGRITRDTGAAAPVDLGKLEVLSGVSEFPTRVKCATLAWHTLNAALEDKGEPVTSE